MRKKESRHRKISRQICAGRSGSHRDEEINREWKILCMLVMIIDHVTGKEAKELVREKSKNKCFT